MITKFKDQCDESYFNSMDYVDKKYPNNHFVHYIIVKERVDIKQYVNELKTRSKSHPVLAWIRQKLSKNDYMAYKILQHGIINPFHSINDYYKNRQGLIKLRCLDINRMFKNNVKVTKLMRNSNICLKIYGLVIDFKMISLTCDDKKDAEFTKRNFL